MLALLVAAIVADATPLLQSPWQAMPTGSGEYARYQRTEQDGAVSAVYAARSVCDCQPVVAVRMLASRLRQEPGASVSVASKTICGEDAQHLIATGLATPQNSERRNIDVFFFRIGPALYTLTYVFSYDVPMPDAEQALTAFCPSS